MGNIIHRLVAPISVSIGAASTSQGFDLTVFIEKLMAEISSFTSIGRVFSSGYTGIFFKTLLYFQLFMRFLL